MSRFLFVFMVFCFPFCLCFSQDITLNSQEDVDAFNSTTTTISGNLIVKTILWDPITNLSNLTNLTSIGGDLEIENNNLINLDELANLSTIGGDLKIRFNDNLIDLNGLANISTIGGFLLEINNNAALIDVDGLANIFTIGGNLLIRNNGNLINIDGLANISTIGGNLSIGDNGSLTNIGGLANVSSIGGDLWVGNNGNLINLEGLANVSTIGENLEISDNDNLIDLEGLANISTIEGNLVIVDNDNLMNLGGLPNIPSIGGNLWIQNNGNLINVDGLANISTIGGYLSIRDNDNLLNVDGLANISTIGESLGISFNDNLLNLDGLANISTIGTFIEITINHALINLDGLANVSSIGGSLWINNNANLINVDGLANISTVEEELGIINNANLINVDGLANISTIGERLLIRNNSNLMNIDGLANLSTIEGNVWIRENDNLMNIDGLVNLSVIEGSLWIADNGNLMNIDGLANLSVIGGSLLIEDNVTLTNCCGIQGLLLTQEAIGGSIIINNNPLECSNIDEILVACDIISGFCYYDQNENGLMDGIDIGLASVPLTIEPNTLTNFTFSNGEYHFAVDNGTYNVFPQVSENWSLTSDSSSYTITVEDNTIQNLNFGFKPLIEIDEVRPSISSARTRCGFDVPFWINVENTGTTYSSGYISLEIDNLTSFTSAAPEPNSINGNTFTWNFENLPPTHTYSIRLQLQMPGVDYLGEIVTFNTTVFVTDSTGIVQNTLAYKYGSVINCAYDPNDKLVSPEGVQEEQYTLFGEELEYTVRFQNTGTDTAFTIKIEDQLDANLDWGTFRPVAASDPYEVSVFEGRLLRFTFNDILLPDSTVNEVASHGFVKYRIMPLSNLAENTVIENTADIFFDFNPPIQTNTTFNTMVSEIPENSHIVRLSPKVFLSGAFDSVIGMMHDNIRQAGIIPLSEPYTSMPEFTHIGDGGGETIIDAETVLGVTGANAIVDWVFIELRDKNDASEAVSTRAALLQKDGDVVDVDGVSPLVFNVVSEDYYIAVRHRNHLGAMTNVAIRLNETTKVVDFSTTTAPGGITTWGIYAQRYNGVVYSLWPGNANGDKFVKFNGQANDKDVIAMNVIGAPGNIAFSSNYILSGYNTSDINMDGFTKFEGFNDDKASLGAVIINHDGNLTFAFNYVIIEQLP